MMQVLVVDDQRMPRDNMEQILAASGRYEVAASISSAELAIIKCKQQPIDLILMDVQMPHMDGYKATETIRELSDEGKAHIPIVALTANAFEEDRKMAISKGMNDHIAKPIDVKKVEEVIISALK